MFDFAIDHLDFAGGTQPVAAGMRQVDTGAQGGVENGLAGFDCDGLAQRFDR